MSPTIEVTERVRIRVRELAGPLFSDSDVIERLLNGAPVATSAPRVSGATMSANLAGSPELRHRGLESRNPRERGAVVKLAGRTINAASVRDLFHQVLRLLVDEGLIAKIDPLLPVRTSAQRYLIARKPQHPTGNPFVAAASYKGYHMESHKNYRNAVGQLAQLAAKVGISFEYVA